MAALNFPGSPSNGQTYTANGLSYTWDGTAWRKGSSDSGVPSGVILLWYGNSSNIPTGWVICDGSNGTPDLRDKFVVGASAGTGDTTYPGVSPSATGGYTDVFIPEHNHTFSGNTGYFDTSHTHGYTSANHPTSSGPEQNQSGGPEDRTTFNVSKNTGGPSANSNHRHSYSGTTANNTGGAAITNAQRSGRNLPPYYALCYIMKS
tara:strand:- start:246 stop:860 length:615 start_codon:yes stop_codon:yes gene_type:complete